MLDATGQARAVIDARGNEAFTYVRDLRGRLVAQTSLDAGAAWAVTDGYDRAVQSWDARGYAVTRGYDLADRPTTVHVAGGDGATAMDAVVETYRYGDQAADRAAAVAANTLGRLVEVRDGAGVVTVTAYDPRGAVRVQGRQLRGKVNEEPEWRRAEDLEAEVLAQEPGCSASARPKTAKNRVAAHRLAMVAREWPAESAAGRAPKARPPGRPGVTPWRRRRQEPGCPRTELQREPSTTPG